ncbi:HAD family hydrolase [Celeribacter persicus]|jgi:Predicted hydrolase (HAD superfamily)|uniref:Putative hydrolase of the HAD superfamily n=1 Tax=Celeribacter persicus TaxID=1651082 RepID=A0A2T5HPB8_9RHOB|nr:HAD family hydrolase [Celeribacter persicus]PTQ73387.1 putative hydrolase of the HAD superfamily [Celeribacter persicus]
MPDKFATIAFDADDTLWENEQFFRMTQDRFAELLADFTEADHLAERLLAAERRNLGHYGFGIKGFVLSMIETAIEVTEERVPASVISELISAGQDMLRHPINLLDGVEETIGTLAETHEILLVTKGDLLDQERKLAQSGLGDLFDGIEVVSAKTPEVYSTIFARHGIAPERAMMVGNSMKSDVLPPIEIGAWGVYVPHNITWAIEHAEAPEGHPRYRTLDTLRDLPGLIATL